jgi:hypothetical protein
VPHRELCVVSSLLFPPGVDHHGVDQALYIGGFAGCKPVNLLGEGMNVILKKELVVVRT